MDDLRGLPFPTRECPGLEELTEYVDGQVLLRDRERIEAHLTTCALCRNDVVELFAVIGLLGGLDAATPRRSFRIGPSQVPHRIKPSPGSRGSCGGEQGK